MTEPKTFAERLDAARDGREFGILIQDMLSCLDDAKASIENASDALKKAGAALAGDDE